MWNFRLISYLDRILPMSFPTSGQPDRHIRVAFTGATEICDQCFSFGKLDNGSSVAFLKGSVLFE
jgi:hypothetical protein